MNIFKKITEYLLKKSKKDPNKHRYFYESDIIDNDGKEYKPLMNSHGSHAYRSNHKNESFDDDDD